MTATMPHPPAAEPTIDQRLTELMPALDEQTYRDLEASILRDGCTDPLVVWQERGVLLDGRHRLRICREHGRPWSVVEISLPDDEAARAWVMERALARRNLSPWHVKYYRGQLYRASRRDDRANLRRGRQDSPAAQVEQPGEWTAVALSERLGVGQATIRRDAKFAHAVEQVAEDVRPRVLAGQVEGLRSPADVVEAVRTARVADPAAPVTLPALERAAAPITERRHARSAQRDPRAAAAPFRQFSVRKVESYTDPTDGKEYVDWITLSCGCRAQAKRRMTLDARRKSMACPTHSGLRRPHERRIERRTLARNLATAWQPERRDHLIQFVESALRSLCVQPTDVKLIDLRATMQQQASLAGLYDEPEDVMGRRGTGATVRATAPATQHAEEE